MIERRTAIRFPVDWQIQVQHSEGSRGVIVGSGVLRNISSGGALFSLAVQLVTGSQLDVYIRLPLTEKKWMRYAAFVVRVEPGSTTAAYAVNFTGPRPEFAGPIIPA